jgi:hypothetical protein
LFSPITNALQNSIGTDALFELYLPVNALDGRKPAERQAIQQAIIAWVKATASAIPKRPFPDYRGTLAGPVRPAGVPFDLALCANRRSFLVNTFRSSTRSTKT